MKNFKRWLLSRNWLLGVLGYMLLSGPALLMYYKALRKHLLQQQQQQNQKKR